MLEEPSQACLKLLQGHLTSVARATDSLKAQLTLAATATAEGDSAVLQSQLPRALRDADSVLAASAGLDDLPQQPTIEPVSADDMPMSKLRGLQFVQQSQQQQQQQQYSKEAGASSEQCSCPAGCRCKGCRRRRRYELQGRSAAGLTSSCSCQRGMTTEVCSNIRTLLYSELHSVLDTQFELSVRTVECSL
jgi:hypothetical protein